MPKTEFHPDLLRILLKKAEEESRPIEVLQRLHWFLDYADHRSVSKLCQKFNIARSTYYRWIQRFDPSDLATLEDSPTIPAVIAEHDPSDPIDHDNLFVGNSRYKGLVNSVPSVMRYSVITVLFALFINTGMLISLLSGNSAQPQAQHFQADLVNSQQADIGTGSLSHFDPVAQSLKLKDCTQIGNGEWNCTVFQSPNN